MIKSTLKPSNKCTAGSKRNKRHLLTQIHRKNSMCSRIRRIYFSYRKCLSRFRCPLLPKTSCIFLPDSYGKKKWLFSCPCDTKKVFWLSWGCEIWQILWRCGKFWRKTMRYSHDYWHHFPGLKNILFPAHFYKPWRHCRIKSWKKTRPLHSYMNIS